MTKLGGLYKKNEIGEHFSGVKDKPEFCYPIAYWFGHDYVVLDSISYKQFHIIISFFDSCYTLVSGPRIKLMKVIFICDKLYVIKRTHGHVELMEVKEEDGTLFPELTK